jgi:hypothetical protein
LPAPGVTGVSVSNLTTTSAVINGVINPNGTFTTAKFQSGTTKGYGTDTVIPLRPPSGVTDQNASALMTGLTPGSTYHFRVTATNVGGTTESVDVAFSAISTDATLFSLAPGSGTLAPSFTSANTAYTDSVSNPTATVTFTPVSTNANATIQVRVNGNAYGPVASGSPSGPLALNVGANTVDVLVTAQDGVTAQTYSIAVTRRTSYEDWMLATGISGPNSGPNADFDGDGIPNILEFGFGTNPASGSTGSGSLVYSGTFAGGGAIVGAGQPILMTETITNGVDFRALYVRRKDYVSAGLTYSVEFSNALAAWTPSGTAPSILADDGTYQVVSVPYPPFVGGKKARFFRVRVTLGP